MAWIDELSSLQKSHLMGYKVTVFVFQNVFFYRGDGLLTMNTFKDLLKQKLCFIRSQRFAFAVLNGIFYCPNLTGMENKIKFAHLKTRLKNTIF